MNGVCSPSDSRHGPTARCAPTYTMPHKGMFKITRGDIHGDPSNIDEDGTSTIDAVLNAYGKMGAYQLSELTHSERPWRDARGDLPQGAICNTEITEAAMAEYYGSLTD